MVGGPTPRSIPYVTVALEKGLLTSAHLEHLREPITRSEMIVYFRKDSRDPEPSEAIESI